MSTNNSDNNYNYYCKRSKHLNNYYSYNSSNKILYYYYLKKGYIAPEYKTRIKAKKLQKQQQFQSSNSNTYTTNTYSNKPTIYTNIANSTILACITLLASQDPIYRSA